MKIESSSWLYKYRHIFISIFIVIVNNIINIKPINTIPHETLEYKVHFFLMSVLYWLLAYVIYSLGRIIFLRNHWIFKIIGSVTFVYCLYIIVLPVKTYIEIDRLEKQADYYHKQADSLRKIGK